jgi:cytochrome bd-type quinol oxidase subunit 2
MIQRIQSLYLLSSVIFIFLMFFIPVAELAGYESSILVFAHKGIYSNNETYSNTALLIILSIIILLHVLAIFSYSNRKKQVLITKISVIMLIISLVFVLLFPGLGSSFYGNNDVLTSYKFGAIMPLFSMVFDFLAIRRIKKDEELVRSADRLR